MIFSSIKKFLKKFLMDRSKSNAGYLGPPATIFPPLPPKPPPPSLPLKHNFNLHEYIQLSLYEELIGQIFKLLADLHIIEDQLVIIRAKLNDLSNTIERTNTGEDNSDT